MVSYKLVFNRKNQLDQAGTALMQIEAYHAGQRRYFTTGVRITPAQWNAKNREVRSNASANQRIRKLLGELQQFELTFDTLHGRTFSLADFDLMQTAVTTQPAHRSFSAYMKAEIDADKPGVAQSTYQRRRRVLNRLEKHHGGPVAFSELTFAFINRFDQAKRGRFKLDDNTIESEHKILKRYITRAVKSNLLDRNPYDQFKFRGKPVDKVVLAEEEIRRLETLVLEEEHAALTIYRDAFLLAYYTMLRVGDLISLTAKHITGPVDAFVQPNASSTSDLSTFM